MNSEQAIREDLFLKKIGKEIIHNKIRIKKLRKVINDPSEPIEVRLKLELEVKNYQTFNKNLEMRAYEIFKKATNMVDILLEI